MEENKPNRYKLDTSNVAVVPKIESLLSDALVVIGSELARYRAKAARGASLDTHEARAVREYVECICKLSKEAREAILVVAEPVCSKAHGSILDRPRGKGRIRQILWRSRRPLWPRCNRPVVHSTKVHRASR